MSTDQTEPVREAGPEDWGLLESYVATDGSEIRADPDVIGLALDAMDASFAGPPPGPALVVTQGAPLDTDAAALRFEFGGEIELRGSIPGDVPIGYHTLTDPNGSSTPLIVSPQACYLPSVLRAWGWAVQLYAARSTRSWGIGDLGDLLSLARWSKELGAATLLVSPLHAAAPGVPQNPSPYFPSSRCFRSPLYLRIEDIPGADDPALGLEALGAAGRTLNSIATIDHDQVLTLKLRALEKLFRSFTGDPSFDAFVAEGGTLLRDYATFAAIAELHGNDHRTWPSGFDDPSAPKVEQVRSERAERVRFHQWMQWHLADQFARAASEIHLIADLALGFDPGGADAWMFKNTLAMGVTVGAPPDDFNKEGQDWSFTPFDPWRLRAAGYEPFITTLRASMTGAKGLRIDHIMGLFRQFWIPAGLGPRDGVYVTYPLKDLLAIVALESHRARCFVVGEDLGTVPHEVRTEMENRSMLGCRVGYFEDDPPEKFPELSLASVTNHDLPTIAGLWAGPDSSTAPEMRRRLQHLAGASDGDLSEEVVAAAYDALASGSSALLVASLEDALVLDEPPNRPGTSDADRPNWRTALPVAFEQIAELPLPRQIAASLRRTSL